jgi:hypothetical protein
LGCAKRGWHLTVNGAAPTKKRRTAIRNTLPQEASPTQRQ